MKIRQRHTEKTHQNGFSFGVASRQLAFKQRTHGVGGVDVGARREALERRLHDELRHLHGKVAALEQVAQVDKLEAERNVVRDRCK